MGLPNLLTGGFADANVIVKQIMSYCWAQPPMDSFHVLLRVGVLLFQFVLTMRNPKQLIACRGAANRTVPRVNSPTLFPPPPNFGMLQVEMVEKLTGFKVEDLKELMQMYRKHTKQSDGLQGMPVVYFSDFCRALGYQQDDRHAQQLFSFLDYHECGYLGFLEVSAKQGGGQVHDREGGD